MEEAGDVLNPVEEEAKDVLNPVEEKEEGVLNLVEEEVKQQDVEDELLASVEMKVTVGLM